METLICPLCDGEMNYRKNKETHIWVCEECPAVLFEYVDESNTLDLIDSLK